MKKTVDLEHAIGKIEKILSIPSQRDPYKRFTILSYQLANAGKSLRYMRIFPCEEKAHREGLKADLGDLLIQTLTLARLYGFDIEDVLKIGADRLEEFQERSGYKDD